MARKKTITFAIFIILFVNASAKGKKIRYHLPPKADSIVANYLEPFTNNVIKKNLFLAVLSNKNDTFELYITKRTPLKLINFESDVVKSSNRFLNIHNDRDLPLIISGFDNLLIHPDYTLQADGHTSFNDPIILYHAFFMKFTLFNEIISYSRDGYGED